MDRIPIYLRLSEQVAGWTRGPEAEALIRAAYELPDQSHIVEIGSFLGSGAILLAGARKLRRSGKVHCVDPFDASGDVVSIGEYQRILTEHVRVPQIEAFHGNLRRAGLTNWIQVHQGQAETIAAKWETPVDMIFMDGDQSEEGVRRAFESWRNWLKPGGVLALHNSNPREYAPGHEGHFVLRERLLAGSEFKMVEEAGSISFFRRANSPSGDKLGRTTK